MAREGKKLELYEVLAAKRAKGKMPSALETKQYRQANMPEEPDPQASGTLGVIIDDAVAHMANPQAQAQVQAQEPEPAFPRPGKRDTQFRPRQPEFRDFRPAGRSEPPPPESPEPRHVPEPRIIAEPIVEKPPRPRSRKEVVFALDTAFIFFTVMLALVGSSYFLGYKRGQEERPAGLTGLGDIEVTDPDHLNLRHLDPAPRTSVRPSEQDYTLILRTETVSDDLPERLELELAEAVARGKQGVGGMDVQGFIFRTGGTDPRYVLAVGLGRTANDADLEKLRQVYYKMEGVTLSREPKPYIGCRIAPVRELGTLVY